MKIIDAEVDYKLIGERIRAERMKAGISQDKLAEKIDIATAYISRIERGLAIINLKRLAQIAKALEVPLSSLVSDTTKESENYLSKEFQEVLSQCSGDKQRLIYNIAKVVAGIKFVK